MGRGRGSDLHERVLLGIGCVVTFVWAVATLVQVVLPSHPVSNEVHLVMLAVAGFFFGGAAISAKRGEKNGNGNGEEK